MDYRKRFESFRKGELEGGEKAEIENDIERQRVIGDYIDEEIDEGLFEDGGRKEGTVGGTEENAALINKAVSRKLRKYSACAGAIVLAIAVFLIFGLSPLVDSVYYDPGKKITSNNITRNTIDLPLSVYTELRCAEKKYNFSDVEPEGYGKYGVKITLAQDRGNIEKEIYYLTMDKGKFTEKESGWQSNFPETYFQDMASEDSQYNNYDDSADIAKLEKLPETAVVTACFCFKQYEDLSFINELDNNSFHITYVPISISDKNNDGSGLYFGYSLKTALTSPRYVDDTKYIDFLKRYPELDLSEANPVDFPAERLETHFKSMLKYMADEKDLNFALDDDPKIYSKALDYVEKNGVKAFGAVVSAPVGELLKMRQNSEVKTMNVVDVKLYEFYKDSEPFILN